MSHDFSVMEIGVHGIYRCFHAITVSIEPRLFSHGNVGGGLLCDLDPTFVSIEPRLFSHGNGDIPLPTKLSGSMFQLSHDFSVMEMTLTRHRPLTMTRCFN